SPQLYKQLLMASGMDKYFQISKCFRNEPRLTPDRQPEFTVLDMEMAFVDEDDVYPIVDGLLAHIWAKIVGRRLETPVKRITYAEAMEKYGTDRPDLRFELELGDITAAAARWPVPAIREAMHPVEDALAEGQVRGVPVLRALRVPGVGAALDGFLPGIGAELRPLGQDAQLFHFKVIEGLRLVGPLAKHFDEGLSKELCSATGGRAGDVVFLVAAPNRASANAVAAELRLRVARELNLVDRTRHELLWVNEFPFWEYDPRAQGWTGCRHPFTQPLDSDLMKLETEKYSVRAKAYDLVLNGVELGAGSIRNHDVHVQQRVFDMFEYKREDVYKRWGFVLEAFKFGVPPHGGLSIGLDRLIAQLLGVDAMDEVIAFPKDRNGNDPMVDAPTKIDPGYVRQMLT
ncbi:MAG TPA: amino acid--tRNA ligase-related protein, partial [Planctomycetota bacterium]|nr:amino acid--tRNA ligase-related protein [Planctomycetota bacterium]